MQVKDRGVEMGFRICIDIGGTFTDLVVIDEQMEVSVFKSPTTPSNFIDGMIAVLNLASPKISVIRERSEKRCRTYS